MDDGKVIGGHYVGAVIRKAAFGSDLVVQVGLRGRRLNAEEVAQWTQEASETNQRLVSKVSQAVTKAVVPRHLRSAAAAAVGATVDAKIKPWHTVRVEWVDGKQSLLRLSDEQFVHFELMLQARRSDDAPAVPTAEVAISLPEDEAPNIANHAFALAASVLDKIPNRATKADISDQLTSLAALRDAGVLTDEEFAAKKREILARI